MGSVDHKYYSGNVIFLNGDLVAWFTQKIPVVSVSSTEGECIALSDTYKDGLDIYHLLNDIMQVMLFISIHMATKQLCTWQAI